MHKNILLHLSLIEEVGALTIKHILDNTKNINLSDIYKLSVGDLIRIFSLQHNKAQLIFNGLNNKSFLEDELELIEKHDIKILSLLDDDYPYLLKEISSAPAILYVKGNLDNIENSIAVVGSRRPTYYGKSVTQAIVPDLVNSGFCIVSGGAYGIDTLAHKEAINASGRTVAVLGSGLLKPYPAENKKLFDDIIACDGAVISCFPLNFEPLPGNFPARNRLISGLSKGTLVVQAANKSGALITAHYAIEQNREVFAIPGNITEDFSAGCNNLIKQGAKLVNSIEDILEEFGFTYTRFNKLDILHNDGSDVVNDPLLNICSQPRSLEEIVEISGMGQSDVQIKLFDLQIQGKIEQNFAGLWQAV